MLLQQLSLYQGGEKTSTLSRTKTAMGEAVNGRAGVEHSLATKQDSGKGQVILVQKHYSAKNVEKADGRMVVSG